MHLFQINKEFNIFNGVSIAIKIQFYQPDDVKHMHTTSST